MESRHVVSSHKIGSSLYALSLSFISVSQCKFSRIYIWNFAAGYRSQIQNPSHHSVFALVMWQERPLLPQKSWEWITVQLSLGSSFELTHSAHMGLTDNVTFCRAHWSLEIMTSAPAGPLALWGTRLMASGLFPSIPADIWDKDMQILSEY